MSRLISIEIREELQHPFFFQGLTEIQVEKDKLQTFCALQPFLYDAAYEHYQEALRPWEQPELYIPLLLKEWEQECVHLNSVFAQRQRAQGEEGMRKGIGLLLQFIFWANEQPCILTNQSFSKGLRMIPINFDERLRFIMQRPGNFHAYKQLNELISEMKKHYLKAIAMKKASKPNA